MQTTFYTSRLYSNDFSYLTQIQYNGPSPATGTMLLFDGCGQTQLIRQRRRVLQLPRPATHSSYSAILLISCSAKLIVIWRCEDATAGWWLSRLSKVYSANPYDGSCHMPLLCEG